MQKSLGLAMVIQAKKKKKNDNKALQKKKKKKRKDRITQMSTNDSKASAELNVIK